MTDIERQAREAAIDHGMWLAADDNETNYQAFIAGYYRGWSDKGAEIAKSDLSAAEPREKENAELRARVAELEGMVPRWACAAESSMLEGSGWLQADDNKRGNGPRMRLMVPPILSHPRLPISPLRHCCNPNNYATFPTTATSARSRNFRPVLREKCGIRGRLKNEGPIRWCGSTPLTHRTWKEAR